MNFEIYHRDTSSPQQCGANDDIPDLVWSTSFRDFSNPSDMQCLSLIRRESGNVVSMKIVLRAYEAE